MRSGIGYSHLLQNLIEVRTLDTFQDINYYSADVLQLEYTINLRTSLMYDINTCDSLPSGHIRES